jgi:tetratricopeptide (TPR) repeat protein
LKRFKQELILARQVTHRNVIRIFDLGQADGLKFITMEFLEGQDLRAELKKRGKFSPEDAARIILQISRALEVAHGEGVVHRDLKPQNIMLDANGRAYVMDFGIARSAYLPGMTQTGALIGTPEYMSPEQAKGEKLDERSDLFSLGVIFYELLTGNSPYYSDTPLATLWRRMQEKAKPLAEIDPTIPREISDIVAKLLEIEPAKRFANAGELTWRLESWLGISNPTSTATGTVALPVVKSSFHWKWVAAGLALLLAAGGVAFWLKSSAKPKAAHAPVSVLVADFTNHTGDPIFDGTLEPMFNVALEGASFINAVNRGNARKLAQQLPHPTNKLDEQSARLVAVSQGYGAIVTGSLSSRGDGYRLSVEAVDAVTGKSLASADISAANKDQVLLDIPKLAAPVRKALGDTTPQSVQLAAAQGTFAASNLEAVHQYGTAMEQQFAGNLDASLKSFGKAVELDPNFARAYAGMAGQAANLGKLEDADRYIKLAMQHVDRMTDRERYRIRGLYYGSSGDWQKCVEEYGELVRQYPADNIGHNNLANCYSHLRKLPEAVQEVRRALEITNSVTWRANLSLFSSYAGEFEGGLKEARQIQQRSPSFAYGYLAAAFAQLGQSRPSDAVESYRSLEKLGPMGASMAASGLADVAMYEGRFTDAVDILERGAAADVAGKNSDGAADKFSALATVQLWMHRKGAAIDAAEKALAQGQSVKTRFLAARVFAEAGEIVEAQKLADGLTSELQIEPQAYGRIIEGNLALKRGDASEAIRELTEANKLFDTWIGRFDLGRAYIEAGAFAQADSEFDNCIKRRGEALALFLDEAPTYGYFPAVYYYQGRVREGLKSPGAKDSYKMFLTIKAKGQGVDPLVQDAQRRLAAL